MGFGHSQHPGSPHPLAPFGASEDQSRRDFFNFASDRDLFLRSRKVVHEWPQTTTIYDSGGEITLDKGERIAI